MKQKIIKIISKYTNQVPKELDSFASLNIDLMDLMAILVDTEDMLARELGKPVNISKRFNVRDLVRDLIKYAEELRGANV